MPNKTVYLKNYQPPVFAIETVFLDFSLLEDHVLVTSKLQVQRRQDGPLYLYGDELELLSIHLDDKKLDKTAYRLEEGNLVLDQCPDAFKLEVVTRIRPQENSKLSGLYRSQQLFCTQCEAEGFRRITFFPDRPDVLATYTTRIEADKSSYPLLLSNGNPIDKGEAKNGRHWAVWEDPFKKPSYLFALVAGNLACVEDEFITASGKRVVLRIYVEPGNEDKCAHAMSSLKKAMRWDEEIYGREYDLAILMIVAVSDFNMGAMENKGLMIFNAKYILARPETATDQDFINIENVVAHEYFHNWTGNRITCRDWFQLSLKEGLTVFRDQEFSRDMNDRDVSRISDVKALLTSQFPEDASRMAHPVRPSSYQEINNFYTATIYNKGAEVIRMQHRLLGKAGFRRGMDLYFQRHDGHAVTIDDFVAAMEDANKVDFSQLKRWYSQAGTPIVQVDCQYQEGCLNLTLTQSCPITPDGQEKKPFHIPLNLALFSSQGQKLPIDQSILELREAQQNFQFTGLSEKPIVSLLREFSAPIKLMQSVQQEDLLALLRFETDGYAKWNAARCLIFACLSDFLTTPTQDWQIPDVLVAAFSHVLTDNKLHHALRAEILTPPAFEEVILNLKNIDVAKVEAARDFYRVEIAKTLFTPLQKTYKMLWEKETHSMDASAYGRRKLRNLCLTLLMKANEVQNLPVCQEQFQQARTMSDQLASFTALTNCSQAEARETAILQFYQQWSKEDLVLDKWFTIQATCELPSTLEQVKNLMKHPAFSLKNPNKVRAVIGAFTQANPRHFHAADGSGYQFLGEMIAKIDPLNPQIASRLATPFTRWQQFDEIRQDLIKAQLNQLSTLNLSRDVQELVTKSLAV